MPIGNRDIRLLTWIVVIKFAVVSGLLVGMSLTSEIWSYDWALIAKFLTPWLACIAYRERVNLRHVNVRRSLLHHLIAEIVEMRLRLDILPWCSFRAIVDIVNVKGLFACQSILDNILTLVYAQCSSQRPMNDINISPHLHSCLWQDARVNSFRLSSHTFAIPRMMIANYLRDHIIALMKPSMSLLLLNYLQLLQCIIDVALNFSIG